MKIGKILAVSTLLVAVVGAIVFFMGKRIFSPDQPLDIPVKTRKEEPVEV